MNRPYDGQRICLTTLHGKERALARPFAVGLGACLEVSPCDTNRLGTFSGEVLRLESALDTCRQKALLGLERTGLRLGLASEASFGPHPSAPMLPIGQELLVFLDLDRELTVVEQRLEWRTNYAQKQLRCGEDPAAWLQQVGFPSHGLMARPASLQAGPWHHDLCSMRDLHRALEACRRDDPQGEVWLETDMRAHRNPTRLRSIRRLGVALVRRLQCPCPRCGSPGWGLVATEPGLPCECCGTPTDRTRVEVWGCPRCEARDWRPRRDGLAMASPAHCPSCNP
ncbi:MAG: DUF6671 family protein [Vulcanococcus sp.]